MFWPRLLTVSVDSEDVEQPTLSPRLLTRSAVVVLAIGALAAALLHLAAGHTYPIPWPDEIDFIAPAGALARHFTFAMPDLRAPHGIFWVPDAFYLLLAPVFRLAPVTIDTARWVSFAAVLLAALGFWTAAVRASVRPLFAAVVVAFWLMTPSAVVAGNMGRQDAMVIAFVAWSLAATFGGRRVLALALAGAAALVHPAGVPFALILASANVGHRPIIVRRRDWVVAGLVVMVALVEVVHMGTHASLTIDQLRFQLHRKAGRDPQLSRPVLLALVALAAAGINQVRRHADPRAAVLLGLAGAGLLVESVGQEIWYQVYGFELALVMGALAALIVIGHAPVTTTRVNPSIAIAALLAVGLLATGSFARTVNGMRFHDQPREWDAFVVDVRAELTSFADSSSQPRTVLINALSGLPWPAETDHIGNLRLVKETSVTRAHGGYAYELFARTVCCAGKQAIPRGRILARVSSAHHTFDATLLAL